MKGMFVLTVIVLSWIISFAVGEYNSVLGEILEMAMVHPLLLIFLSTLLLIIYIGLRRIFNKEEKEIKIEAITENEEKRSSNSCGYSDMYLTKSILTSDLIEYQIINKENTILWTGRCNLNRGKIHSIILYSGDANKEIVFQVAREATGFEYFIKDSRSIIGSIIITNNGLRFNNIDNSPIYTATPETVAYDGLGAVADLLVGIDTLQAFSSASKVNYITLKGKDEELLGKYYTSLRNIDLTTDTNNNFDRRIAAVFSMFLDSSLIGNRDK